MVGLLAKLFIKETKDTESSQMRQAYGVLCGSAGIFFNVLLALGKFVAGLLSGSIAIMADAANNLSDAGSSLIVLFGFKLAGQKPDPDHPFGHGRVEYISGLLVSMLIIYILLAAVSWVYFTAETADDIGRQTRKRGTFHNLILIFVIISVILACVGYARFFYHFIYLFT